MRNLVAAVEAIDPLVVTGKVAGVSGLLIESRGGLSRLAVGARAEIGRRGLEPLPAEVVGFRDAKALLMPFGPVEGVAPGAGNTGQIAAAPQTGPDVPSLILWHWKDPRMQSQQQVQEAQDKAFSYMASYDFGASKVAKLTDDKMRTVAAGPRDTWGVGSDDAEYERDQGIKGFAFRDMYAVNLATGERKLIQKKVAGGGGGGFGGFGPSPFSPDNGKYAYYDTGDWKVYDFASGATKVVTTGVPAKFWNTEDDHNQVKPAIGGALVGWSKDGAHLILKDNWDAWRVPVNGGAAANITANGQRDQIRYQGRLILDPRERGLECASDLDLGHLRAVSRVGMDVAVDGLSVDGVGRGGHVPRHRQARRRQRGPYPPGSGKGLGGKRSPGAFERD